MEYSKKIILDLIEDYRPNLPEELKELSNEKIFLKFFVESTSSTSLHYALYLKELDEYPEFLKKFIGVIPKGELIKPNN